MSLQLEGMKGIDVIQNSLVKHLEDISDITKDKAIDQADEIVGVEIIESNILYGITSLLELDTNPKLQEESVWVLNIVSRSKAINFLTDTTIICKLKTLLE